MNTPHISGVALPNINANNNIPFIFGPKQTLQVDNASIAPAPCDKLEEPVRLVHPYKLFNFTNEYDKDISKLYGDPCLSPDYSRMYNWKDRKYRGNQFGVRYDTRKIWQRPQYYQKYENKEQTLPVVIKPSPYYDLNANNNDTDIINNRQDIYDEYYRSHPYFYYRYTNTTDPKWLEKPFVQLPFSIENFANPSVLSIGISGVVLLLILYLLRK